LKCEGAKKSDKAQEELQNNRNVSQATIKYQLVQALRVVNLTYLSL